MFVIWLVTYSIGQRDTATYASFCGVAVHARRLLAGASDFFETALVASWIGRSRHSEVFPKRKIEDDAVWFRRENEIME